MAEISLYAPLDGTTVDIKDVPDEVFAKGMVGDGISIDPISNVLKAPIDGEVVNIHSAHHALSIRTKTGVDVLIHIGLDTVNLKGKGFTVKVKQGDKVKVGDALIEFDFALLKKKAKSLLTEMVLSSAVNDLKVTAKAGEKVTAGETVILTAELTKKAGKKCEQTAGEELLSWEITVTDPSGLHARPAAKIADEAKKFTSDILLVKGDKTANAKSVTDMMGLGLALNDKFMIKAKGDDASEALFDVVPVVEDAMESAESDTGAGAKAVPEHVAKPIPSSRAHSDLMAGVFGGTGASDGMAIGKICHFADDDFNIPEQGDMPEQEAAKLDMALESARDELDELAANLKDEKQAEIFKAHQELLADPVLVDKAKDLINAGKSAAFAWDKVCSEEAENLADVNNEVLAARAADIRDVKRRVLLILLKKDNLTATYPENTILVAKELTPSDTAMLDKSRIVGICTTGGSPTSHVAILAKTFGIPSIVGADQRVLNILNGTVASIDGSKGTLTTGLSEAELAMVKQKAKDGKERYELALKKAAHPAITDDGKRVEIVGNIGSLEDAKKMLEMGGEGVGLLRSEFLFMDRTTPPSEDEQSEVYISIAKLLGKKRKLIIRTLDVGGDKPLAYLNMPHEDNPFLGIRGTRLSLANRDMFRSQIRAILTAAPYADIHIMFPMISRYKEVIEAKQIVMAEQQNMGIDPVKIGVMIEVPSAVMIADILAKEVDFFSIGTNDLTQYTLAMDRGNPNLNRVADSLHPAVLKMIKMTVDSAHRYGRFVGVCGGMAGVPETIPLLLGLGVDELSMAPPSIPIAKQLVRSLSMWKCQTMAERALRMPSATAIHTFLKTVAGEIEKKREKAEGKLVKKEKKQTQKLQKRGD